MARFGRLTLKASRSVAICDYRLQLIVLTQLLSVPYVARGARCYS